MSIIPQRSWKKYKGEIINNKKGKKQVLKYYVTVQIYYTVLSHLQQKLVSALWFRPRLTGWILTFNNIFKISKTFFQIYFLTLIALIAALVIRIILAREMGGFISISEKSLKNKNNLKIKSWRSIPPRSAKIMQFIN